MRIFEYREFLVASISPKIIAGIFDISTQFDLAIVIYRYLFRNYIPIPSTLLASAMKAQKMRAITATNFVFIVRMY